jgi:hypothetical protein
MNLANFLPNLVLLSCASLIGMTYEGVTPRALARLTSTVAPDMPRRFIHARVEGTTHVEVMPCHTRFL